MAIGAGDIDAQFARAARSRGAREDPRHGFPRHSGRPCDGSNGKAARTKARAAARRRTSTTPPKRTCKHPPALGRRTIAAVRIGHARLRKAFHESARQLPRRQRDPAGAGEHGGSQRRPSNRAPVQVRLIPVSANSRSKRSKARCCGAASRRCSPALARRPRAGCDAEAQQSSCRNWTPTSRSPRFASARLRRSACCPNTSSPPRTRKSAVRRAQHCARPAISRCCRTPKANRSRRIGRRATGRQVGAVLRLQPGHDDRHDHAPAACRPRCR